MPTPSTATSKKELQQKTASVLSLTSNKERIDQLSEETNAKKFVLVRKLLKTKNLWQKNPSLEDAFAALNFIQRVRNKISAPDTEQSEKENLQLLLNDLCSSKPLLNMISDSIKTGKDLVSVLQHEEYALLLPLFDEDKVASLNVKEEYVAMAQNILQRCENLLETPTSSTTSTSTTPQQHAAAVTQNVTSSAPKVTAKLLASTRHTIGSSFRWKHERKMPFPRRAYEKFRSYLGKTVTKSSKGSISMKINSKNAFTFAPPPPSTEPQTTEEQKKQNVIKAQIAQASNLFMEYKQGKAIQIDYSGDSNTYFVAAVACAFIALENAQNFLGTLLDFTATNNPKPLKGIFREQLEKSLSDFGLTPSGDSDIQQHVEDLATHLTQTDPRALTKALALTSAVQQHSDDSSTKKREQAQVTTLIGTTTIYFLQNPPTEKPVISIVAHSASEAITEALLFTMRNKTNTSEFPSTFVNSALIICRTSRIALTPLVVENIQLIVDHIKANPTSVNPEALTEKVLRDAEGLFTENYVSCRAHYLNGELNDHRLLPNKDRNVITTAIANTLLFVRITYPSNTDQAFFSTQLENHIPLAYKDARVTTAPMEMALCYAIHCYIVQHPEISKRYATHPLFAPTPAPSSPTQKISLDKNYAHDRFERAKMLKEGTKTNPGDNLELVIEISLAEARYQQKNYDTESSPLAKSVAGYNGFFLTNFRKALSKNLTTARIPDGSPEVEAKKSVVANFSTLNSNVTNFIATQSSVLSSNAKASHGIPGSIQTGFGNHNEERPIYGTPRYTPTTITQ